MADDTNEFYHQLKACLESFRSPEALPEVPMTMSSIPRQGLTVKYHILQRDPQIQRTWPVKLLGS